MIGSGHALQRSAHETSGRHPGISPTTTLSLARLPCRKADDMRRLIYAATTVCLAVAGLGAGQSMAAADTTCVMGVSVCATGQNSSGELGDGTTTDSSTFVPVAGSLATPLRSIAAGYNHSLAVAADGSVWAWGNNGHGEIGDGTTVNRTTPIQVVGLGAGANVIQVASSVQTSNSLALKADGTVLAWGYNGQGDLGTGDYYDRLTPTVVTGLGPGSGVVAIAAGTESLALKADGTVLTWGGNNK